MLAVNWHKFNKRTTLLLSREQPRCRCNRNRTPNREQTGTAASGQPDSVAGCTGSLETVPSFPPLSHPSFGGDHRSTRPIRQQENPPRITPSGSKPFLSLESASLWSGRVLTPFPAQLTPGVPRREDRPSPIN